MSLATIPIDPGYTLIIGLFFGLAAAAGPNRMKAFWIGLVACALFGVGLPVIFYIANPAWMWMYWVDPAKVPAWFVVYVFAIYFIPFFAGFAWVPSGKRGWVVTAIVLALQGALMAAVWDRYSVAATYEEFHRGAGVPLVGSKLGTLLNICSVIGFGAMAACWLWARKAAKAQTNSR